MATKSMTSGKVWIIAAILAAGAILNYLSARVTDAFSLPAGVSFVIAACCLIVLLLPVGIPEVVGIGIIAGVLTIVSDPRHLATILGGQAATPAGLMAFFNLVSEPVGIVTCLWAYTILKGKAGAGAPLIVTFLATCASGLAYLVLVYILNPALIAAQPGYPEKFLLLVAGTAVLTAVVVQVLYMARGAVVPSA